MYTHLYCWLLAARTNARKSLTCVPQLVTDCIVYRHSDEALYRSSLVIQSVPVRSTAIAGLYLLMTCLLERWYTYYFIGHLQTRQFLAQFISSFVVWLFPPHPALNSSPDTALQGTPDYLETELGRTDICRIEPRISYDAVHRAITLYSLAPSYTTTSFHNTPYIRNIMQCSMATKGIQTIIAQYEVHRFSGCL